jgi:ABC-2 type transport system ATP-binding protein
MIDVTGLGKRFGEFWALRQVDLRVEPGAFLGVLGRNGAGKTTLVRILTGQMAASEGRATILGLDVAQRPLALRQRLGVMPEPAALLENLTGEQYLAFAGQLHGLDRDLAAARMDELGALLELDFRKQARIAEYSFGMRKKVALASALLHAPELLFLDEPFEGLDPVSSDTLRLLLEALHQRGTTVVMTSHLLGMAERLCTRYLVVDRGRVAADGAAADLFQGVEDLEQFFLRKVGKAPAGTLSWM